jgi:hypothetical protein
MGSITNLKENRTIFIPCGCKSEVLVIEYDHRSEMADLAIYENQTSYKHKLSLWQKIRYCYQVFVENKPYADQMILEKKQILELKLFINSLNVS